MAHFTELQTKMWFFSVRDSEKPLNHWSYSLKSSFASSWNRVTVKFWSWYLQYLQSYLEIFIIHSAAAVPLLKINNISLVYQYIIEIWPVKIVCIWKNGVLLAEFRDKISIFSFKPNWCWMIQCTTASFWQCNSHGPFLAQQVCQVTGCSYELHIVWHWLEKTRLRIPAE